MSFVVLNDLRGVYVVHLIDMGGLKSPTMQIHVREYRRDNK
jgi:hypothetical protein